MSTQLALKEDFSIIEQVVMAGDLSKLNPQQRVAYYNKVCESSGLNPYTNPFAYISLNGKLTLYAKKDCTEQLRKINGVSIEQLDDKLIDDIYIVTAKAKDKTGRVDQAKGAVSLGSLKGEAKANAIMKAETKAKRRVTLSICGMGWTDESEIDSIPNAKPVDVDFGTGEIKQTVIDSTQKVHKLELIPLEEVKVVDEQKKADVADPKEVDFLLVLKNQCSLEYQDNFNTLLFNENYAFPHDMRPSLCKALIRSATIHLEKINSAGQVLQNDH